jgi:hypothetical protein
MPVTSTASPGESGDPAAVVEGAEDERGEGDAATDVVAEAGASVDAGFGEAPPEQAVAISAAPATATITGCRINEA